MAAVSPAHHRQPHAHGAPEARVDAILDVLRADGGRITVGRRAIVHALLTAPDHHVTADDVAAMVQAEHPDVHLSTIYRTLEALERHGVVDRVGLGPGGAVYHLTDHVHHHLVCEVCGSVTEVPATLLTRLAADVSARYGFTVSDHHLVLPGRCRDCQ
jgi:Fur family transcriptional regulator, ferric uptake regulator